MSNQMEVSTPPDNIRIAASLMVLRDGAQGVEVLLMRRPERGSDDFRSGMWVFPGGVVDPGDAELGAHCHGLSEEQARARLGDAAGSQRHFVAALRECFEEAGVLFACASDGTPVDVAARHDELMDWRHRVHAGQASLASLFSTLNWQLDLRELAFFAHWLTPPTRPKRFDTRFFVTRMPKQQRAQADEREALELRWVRPAQAAQADSGLNMLRVTRLLLNQLAVFESAQAGYAQALALQGVNRISPESHQA